MLWRGLLTSAAVVLAALGGMLGLVWLLQRRLLYFPAGPPPPVARVLPEARQLRLRAADGLELAAWFLPAADPALRRPASWTTSASRQPGCSTWARAWARRW